MHDISTVQPVPVYDGGTPIGVITQRGVLFEVIPHDGHSLGLFNKPRLAADAVFEYATARRRCACEG